jgi:hypothetical protein
MIDVKQSFRKGKVIVEVHVEENPTCVECGESTKHLTSCTIGINSVFDTIQPILSRRPTEYKSINAAKKANRLTKYRTVPVKAGAK